MPPSRYHSQKVVISDNSLFVIYNLLCIILIFCKARKQVNFISAVVKILILDWADIMQEQLHPQNTQGHRDWFILKNLQRELKLLNVKKK